MEKRYCIGTSILYLQGHYSSFQSAAHAARHFYKDEEVNIYYNKPNGFSPYTCLEIVGYKDKYNKVKRIKND